MDNAWYLGVRTPEALGMAGAWEDTLDWEVPGCSRRDPHKTSPRKRSEGVNPEHLVVSELSVC